MGMFLGGSNTISDLGSTHFIYANSPAFGLIYKWNLTTRYALRASFITSKLKSSDYYANDLSRFNRFFEVDNKVFEFSAGMEVEVAAPVCIAVSYTHLTLPTTTYV